ncbi:hypothetical protein [Actinoallomurus rhizosphaericola]|uniref:hypothetical protein n=1 Tax=Actinoallomurus rhizosphaericola TaxID=2952536 RepID=UPI002093D22E|nr:hypothetical protein [Actinoallomurus rhizosphaericola]MCO5997766.1 hypothetical protein [Actinoallomurus rhizosphaericola]
MAMQDTALCRVMLRRLADKLLVRGLVAVPVTTSGGAALLRVTRGRRVLFVACLLTSDGRWAYMWQRGYALTDDRRAPAMIQKELAWYRR